MSRPSQLCFSFGLPSLSQAASRPGTPVAVLLANDRLQQESLQLWHALPALHLQGVHCKPDGCCRLVLV